MFPSGSIDRLTLLENNWEKNASYIWGIPLHPLGEMNAITYVLQAQDDLAQMRLRTHGFMLQALINTVISVIFVRNFILSVRIMRQSPFALAGWCCLLQAMAGMTFAGIAMMGFVPSGPSCRQVLWIAGAGLTLSPFCISTVLLQRAYLAHNRNRYILILGAVLLFPQLLYAYYAWISPTIMVPGIGCISCYPPYVPWMKLCIDAPINILLSVAFILVVYRQYRQFGSAAWARLVHDGIQIMCLIVVSNLVCMIFAAVELIGLLSEFFFVLDWVVTSTLLVRHCVRMGATSSKVTPTQHIRIPEEAVAHLETTTSVFVHGLASTELRSTYRGGRRRLMIR
ncbi:hypothetical protein THASP1DRAFT_27623 [Thamnocephalis sphaerospora]|uniref:Uncharacterized protein n=1 Tax=Thamnocephalis sphaerospora TaxID=78915 RepID=A0A4P9XYU1_9FUNG|nr:hypothetical protein THASP1DRAFT_27623 [Thamnocephalis sphaerospora]|eukprot:RKP10610.1 hypothetical protein THASP1DRAFT_27623 [Thamnocephalis sphaerospora]